MNGRRHQARRLGMRVLKIAGWSSALVLLVFLLIQLLLATPWIRGKVAAKISQRAGGLDVEIKDLDWTPWEGATLRGLRIEQPEALRGQLPKPFLSVDEIHVWPDYGAALKGKWRASEVTVRRPQVHASVEMLISIASTSVPQAEPPAAVAVVVPEQSPADVARPLSPAVADGPDAADPEAKPPDVEPAVVPTAEPTPLKPAWKPLRMVVTDGSFELVRAGRDGRLAAMEGMNFDLPFFDEAEEAINSIALVEGGGQTIDVDLQFEMRNVRTGFEFVFGHRSGESSPVAGKINLGVVAGIPFQADLGFQLSELKRMELSKEIALGSGELRARIQGGGWLLAPGSWRSISQVGATEIVGSISGQPVRFESASGSVLLSGGVIQSPDFRLIGDSASILGNGWVTSRDGAAVARVVVPYPLVGVMNGELRKRAPDGVFAFKPLVPDNRWYSDVSLWREKEGWSVGFGEKGTVMELRELIDE